jgi:hypothetical protein
MLNESEREYREHAQCACYFQTKSTHYVVQEEGNSCDAVVRAIVASRGSPHLLSRLHPTLRPGSYHTGCNTSRADQTLIPQTVLYDP